MIISGVSASSLTTYSDCQFKFFLSQICKFESVSGPSAVMGHIAHKFFEILAQYKKRNKPVDDVKLGKLWDACFNHYYRKVRATEKIDTKKLSKICEGIHEYLACDHSPLNSNVLDSEKAFMLPLEEKTFWMPAQERYLNIRGVIDRIDKIDHETIEIVDYKTGTRTNYTSKERLKKDEDYLYEQIQPRIYSLAAHKLYPWAKNHIITFVYLTDGGPITLAFNPEKERGKSLEMIKDSFLSITNNHTPTRSIGWPCKAFCEYGGKDFANSLCTSIWDECHETGFNTVKEKYYSLNVIQK